MAELVSIKRNVDVSPGQAAPAVFHCSQGDVGSKIILGLLNNGTAYSIPSGVTVTIEGSESNGSIFTPISATAFGSDITFYLTGEMTAVAGPAICQAVLKSGSNILGTANFTLEVESSPMGADAPPVFTDAGWTWMLNKLNTEFVPALGNETIIDAIDGKLDKNQGTANAGKYLKVGADGNVETADLDVTTDKTLSIADKAADAKAVGDELSNLKADLKSTFETYPDGIEAVVGAKPYAFTNGYYNTPASGDAVAYNPDSTFVCTKIPVSEGDTVTLSASAGTGIARLYAFIDANGNAIGRCATNLSGVRTLTAPAGAKYLAINNSLTKQADGYYAYTGTAIKDTVDYQGSLIADLEDFTNYISQDIWKHGAISSTGEEGNSHVYCRTSFIPIGAIHSVFKPSGTLTMFAYYYDTNKAFIGRTGYTASQSIDYDSAQVKTAWGDNSAEYLRFTAKRTLDGSEVNSTPADILAAGLEISVYGVSNIVYQKILSNSDRIEALEISGNYIIPAYYTDNDYLQNRLNKITQIQNSVSANNDAFWLMSDYHYRDNAGNSKALLKYLSKQTGITRLHFGGDAGGSEGTSDTARLQALQHSANVWSELSEVVPEMYGVLGNHEWISSYFGISAMISAYLNRYKIDVVMDKDSGNYYIDNTANKIRYFFLQDTMSAAPVSSEWFGEQLKLIPEDYSVCVLVHHGYIPSAYTEDEYGITVQYNYSGIKGISKMLKAWRDKETTTVYGEVYDYTTGTSNRSVIAVLCAHMHHSTLYDGSTDSEVEGITVFRASEDALNEKTIGINGHPWFWGYNEATGEYDIKTERTKGTVYEQCFYCVQIDLTNKHMYITTIGGDRDWDFTYEA